jgi:2-amino-4-hydroxy-6-hydroxymethyldihydropteridine diphosphokinase
MDQPAFLNAVAGIETTLSPEELLAALQEIEHRFGRTRTVRWGPRTLDLDLLAYEGERRTTDGLTLPHPRMLERAFVTVPLADVLRLARFARPAWESLRAALPAAEAAAEVRVFAAALHAGEVEG